MPEVPVGRGDMFNEEDVDPRHDEEYVDPGQHQEVLQEPDHSPELRTSVRTTPHRHSDVSLTPPSPASPVPPRPRRVIGLSPPSPPNLRTRTARPAPVLQEEPDDDTVTALVFVLLKKIRSRLSGVR